MSSISSPRRGFTKAPATATSARPYGRFTALLVAGQRPGVDALAQHFGVRFKALIPVAGEAMLSRVARTLVTHPAIGRVIVLAQDQAALTADEGTAWLAEHPGIAFEEGGNSVSGAVTGALERNPRGYPFLLATADNPLLDHATIDAFIRGMGDADLAVALVEKRILLAGYPQSRRTWLKFRGGAYSGANLFLLASRRVTGVLELWRTIEQERKRGRAVIGAFGPLMLLGVVLRILSLRQAIRIAGRRFGLRARAVTLPIAEACIDVDSVTDHSLVSAIFARRAEADCEP